MSSTVASTSESPAKRAKIDETQNRRPGVGKVKEPVKHPIGPGDFDEGQSPRPEGEAKKVSDGEWHSFDVDKWRSAMFETESYHADLHSKTTAFLREILKKYGKGYKTRVIEVGSGTGEFIRALAGDADRLVGLDFNELFVEWCKEVGSKLPHGVDSHEATIVSKNGTNGKNLSGDNIQWIHGDAQKLSQILRDNDAAPTPSEIPIVTCVGNTLGIIHGETRRNVYLQMKEVIGARGILVIAYWDGAYFGDAVQHFYGQNPQLCGTLDGSVIDWATCTLTTKSGYCTHWTTAAEARATMEELGLEVLEIREQSKGVLLAARAPKSNKDTGYGTDETVSQDYYDSDDAFNFYTQIWGGENIHVGIYEKFMDPNTKKIPEGVDGVDIVRKASAEALNVLDSKIRLNADVLKKARLLDMGSAIGGLQRYFALKYPGIQTVGVDLSKKECAMNEKLAKEAGLESSITVKCASFTNTGEPDASFEVVVSEDSFLHAGEYREKSVVEAARVLKPGGNFVFSDIMQADDAEKYRAELQPVYNRLGLTDMGSPAFYKRVAAQNGLKFIEFDDRTHELINHYSSVRDILIKKESQLLESKTVSKNYIEHMKEGLTYWVEAASKKRVVYGFFVFEKSA